MKSTLDPEIKEKWVAALRSGQFKQGRGSLRNGNQYCCLGVLCVISGLGEWESWWESQMAFRYDGDASTCYPPLAFAAAIGLSTGRMSLYGHMNDGDELTFGEIADHIEAHE
jgi:hypothetical protein